LEQPQTAKFVTGSTLRHVLVMTATSSLGLMAVFVVDALNLLYISMLGQQELAAAIGYSGTLMFFLTSFAIGLSIATTAQVSRALGRGDRVLAAQLGGAGLWLMTGAMLVLTLAAMAFARPLTAMLGAEGRTLDLAVRFLMIVLPSTPVMAVGLNAAALLRAKGDAKRSMYVTLSAAVMTAALDPVFIFAFGLGLDGAAIVTVISRGALLAVGLYGVISAHKMAAIPSAATVLSAARPFFAIGLPAVMTQLAMPVGNGYVTSQMSRFGDEAVAAWAIIGRVSPVAFCAVIALSGAVGPILGQNLGARRFDRIQQTMRDSFAAMIIYALIVWLILALSRHQISDAFGATGAARELISFYCLFVAGSFLFNGMLFVANAAFNNLGFPLYSTVSNWGRSTLGVIPFVSLGASWYGATGALAGFGLGAVLFGLGAAFVCFRVIKDLERRNPPETAAPVPPAGNSPFSSGKAATLG
jgi:putative MATE family efflux protein